ncbi:hypothetical protein CBR_g51352 [Chara braunii]|uniref:Retrotransposon gag domain-containing protein n=1 Tax=Chara braunii TaxID=69332 RepID=A0A388M8H5_CHABU|nr:hypothetical protein CBR_g51352 [Chara braunii]|eukprot:GBG90846.1 hypothetical protein CBR_g51352 [Chara braunii]
MITPEALAMRPIGVEATPAADGTGTTDKRERTEMDIGTTDTRGRVEMATEEVDMREEIETGNDKMGRADGLSAGEMRESSATSRGDGTTEGTDAMSHEDALTRGTAGMTREGSMSKEGLEETGATIRAVGMREGDMVSHQNHIQRKMSDTADTGAGQVEVVVKDEGQASPSTTPPPPLTPAQRRKKEIQEKLREQQALLAEVERQEAAELKAATDASRKEYLLQQAEKTAADNRVAQCTRDLAELVILQNKITASHFTNWDERIQRLETRVADLGTQQSKILDAIQNLTAQLTAANVISPLVPVVPSLKPKKPSQPPSPPPSPPPGSPHSTRKSSPSVTSQAKATPPPTFAVVVVGDQRGPKIPAPSKFKGDDPKIDVGDWAAGTRAYLKGFQCPEQQKVATVVGLLEGPAQKWATFTASAQQQTLEDWALALGADKLLQALEDRFADKERARKAADKIVRLGQQRYSGSLQALFAEFEQLTSTPGLVMFVDDLLTNFCRAMPEKFCVALYSAGHKDWRSFGRATLDMEAKLHVQAPSSDRRKGAFPRGGRKGKAAFAYAGSGSASDTGSHPGTPLAGTVSAVVPDVAAMVQQLQAALGAFQKAGSPFSTTSGSKGKSQGCRSSTPARRPNLPRDVHFPADPLNPNTLPWHDLKIQEGVWRKRKERGVCLRCEGQHFLKDCPYMPSPAQSKN